MPDLSVYLNLLFEDDPFADRVDHAAALGADGFEVYGLDHDLDAIAEKRDEHGLEWVYTSAGHAPLTDPERRGEAVAAIEDAVDFAAEYGCHNLNVKAGQRQEGIDDLRQKRSVIAGLREAAPAAEAADVTLVLEPLNTRVDHPGHFTATAAEGFEIVEAVDSPNVRLLFDVYHEQIMAGDVTRRLTENVDLVGHVHIADNPGRHEPGTGEINYGNVLGALAETEYDGFVGCEFHPAGDVDEAVREIKSMLA